MTSRIVVALVTLWSVSALAWTEKEEAKGWVRSDDRNEWYHDGVTLKAGGLWETSRSDDDGDTLEMTSKTRAQSITIMILPTTEGKAVKEVTAAKLADARKRGARPAAWPTKLPSGLKWVGSQYTTHERDDDGDAYDMLHVTGYVTDGSRFAVVDFFEDHPTPNTRPQFMLQPTLESIKFGKRHPER